MARWCLTLRRSSFQLQRLVVSLRIFWNSNSTGNSTDERSSTTEFLLNCFSAPPNPSSIPLPVHFRHYFPATLRITLLQALSSHPKAVQPFGIASWNSAVHKAALCKRIASTVIAFGCSFVGQWWRHPGGRPYVLHILTDIKTPRSLLRVE